MLTTATRIIKNTSFLNVLHKIVEAEKNSVLQLCLDPLHQKCWLLISKYLRPFTIYTLINFLSYSQCTV